MLEEVCGISCIPILETDPDAIVQTPRDRLHALGYRSLVVRRLHVKRLLHRLWPSFTLVVRAKL